MHFNTYAAQEETLDWSGTLNAAVRAALDTGSMFIVSHLMQRFCQSINWMGAQVQQNGFIKASKALSFFSKATQYGVYVYDAVQRGIVDAAASVAAGGLTQYAIEQVGERAVRRGQ